ncbi:MAG: hypothetical protein QOE23_445 [Pseudonocardiales bacterium]|nr:hypothetical protein [Pseudonocardiales bacterium]
MIAGLLLTALAAALALLAQPSSAASLDSYDIRASVRYGCAQNDSEENFVEVTLRAEDWKGGDGEQDDELVLQVGLAGPDSADSDGVFPEGGPSLVTLGQTPTKVRLAGPVHDGDHVFLRQLDQPGVITLPLQSTCHRIKPTNFGLDEPTVRVAPQSCTPGAQANLQVTLDNPNDVDHRLQKMGIEQIDYTVLLVRHDGLLAGADPVGTLISFDEPSASVITLSQVVAKPTNYQVRVIGLDGAVVSSNNLRLSCAGTVPPPPSSPRPTPTVPTSRPGTATPSTSRPAPSTSRPTPSWSEPSSPAPSSPAASRSSAPATSAAPSSVGPAPTTTSPVRSTPAGSSPPVPSTGNSSGSRPAPTASASTPAPSAPASTSAAVPATSSPAPSPVPSRIRLVEPRSDYGPLPVFQKEVALVVLVFSAALAALVGGTVVAARRR